MNHLDRSILEIEKRIAKFYEFSDSDGIAYAIMAELSTLHQFMCELRDGKYSGQWKDGK